jgi:hypothetical protein
MTVIEHLASRSRFEELARSGVAGHGSQHRAPTEALEQLIAIRAARGAAR